MKLLNKIVLNQDQMQLPINLRKVCRVIRDNMDDNAICRLAQELNLNPNSNKQDISKASVILTDKLPFYSLISIDGYDHIVPIRLVKINDDGICKVVPETNIINFIHTLINTKASESQILKINDYVLMSENGNIVRNMSALSPRYKPKTECFDKQDFDFENFRIRLLMKLQRINTPIFPVLERWGNDNEKEAIGYIFTIYQHGSVSTAIYESTDPNKATYLFKIRNALYDTAIKQIRDYFSSRIIGKRAQFLSIDSTFSSDSGFVSRQKIIHRNLLDWVTKIECLSSGISPQLV